MPGRYSIVDEPEALEVTDDDVYHPDQSVRSEPSISVRSLQPIVSGPLNLKDIFYDPTWSITHKKVCLGCYTIIGVLCMSILISLFVGLGNVLHYIDYVKLMRTQGIQMVPDLEIMHITSFIHSKGPGSNKAWHDYVHAIDDMVLDYENKQKSDSYKDCSSEKGFIDDKLCRVDVQKIMSDLNCTNETRYGYEIGKPCIFFKFHKVTKFKPTLRTNVSLLSFVCKAEEVVVRMLPGETQSATINCQVDSTQITNKAAFKGALGVKFRFESMGQMIIG